MKLYGRIFALIKLNRNKTNRKPFTAMFGMNYLAASFEVSEEKTFVLGNFLLHLAASCMK